MDWRIRRSGFIGLLPNPLAVDTMLATGIKPARVMPKQFYLDTSRVASNGARTGIQTVVRGLLAGLSSRRCVAHALRWSFEEACLTPLSPEWELNIGRTRRKKPYLPIPSLVRPKYWPLWARTRGMDYKAPLHEHPTHAEHLNGRWLILPELMDGPGARLAADYARRHGMRVAAIFHDAIAWLHPEVVLHWTREQHADYMRALAELDAVIAVSEQSAGEFTEFLRSQSLPMPPVRACSLSAQVLDQERETRLKETMGDTIKILCVSTLEPRKNHALLIRAFEEACRKVGSPKLELHLVGCVYAAGEIGEAVRMAAVKTAAIFWHGGVSPEELRNFYRECDFTVFASWIEGFGLPVVESLWFGRPCLCSDQGVMAENAKGGGCLTVNMRDAGALADGMVRLASRPEFRRELGEQALRRELKTWDDYAGEILGILEGV